MDSTNIPERIWIDATCHTQDAKAVRAGVYFTRPDSQDKDCVEYVRVSPSIQNTEQEVLGDAAKGTVVPTSKVDRDTSLDVDFDNAAFYAFRYCLGRQTYAVNQCVEILTRNWARLTQATREMIRWEITRAFQENRYGSETDREAWTRVLGIADPTTQATEPALRGNNPDGTVAGFVRDSQRLDWLESVMRPQEGYQEVYLAGLRNGDAPATSFQCELQRDGSFSGASLRDAIDTAQTISAAAVPDLSPASLPESSVESSVTPARE